MSAPHPLDLLAQGGVEVLDRARLGAQDRVAELADVRERRLAARAAAPDPSAAGPRSPRSWWSRRRPSAGSVGPGTLRAVPDEDPDEHAIGYQVLPRGHARGGDGRVQVGTFHKALHHGREHLFDGMVVRTEDGQALRRRARGRADHQQARVPDDRQRRGRATSRSRPASRPGSRPAPSAARAACGASSLAANRASGRSRAPSLASGRPTRCRNSLSPRLKTSVLPARRGSVLGDARRPAARRGRRGAGPR